jgi:hypothetical protein
VGRIEKSGAVGLQERPPGYSEGREGDGWADGFRTGARVQSFWSTCAHFVSGSLLGFLETKKDRPEGRPQRKERSNVCMKDNITPLTETQDEEERELKVFLDLGTGIDNREEYEKGNDE